MLVQRKSIAFLSTDVVLHMVSDTLPELNLTKPYDEISTRFFPYVSNLLKHIESSVKNYTVEGDAFTPSQVALLQKTYNVRSCFLGFSRITLQQLEEHVGENNWIAELPESEKINLPQWIMTKSLQIEEACRTHDVTYIDMAGDSYERCLERAYLHLTEE